ncbi:MAG: DUF11 domain-containing protein, partial [Candidatus Anammoximicrobium sp.]|nr:DUF11 domain-containing protein [Candidatus Anammoximicrobium sp.]
GDPTNGFIMYEAGHSHAKSSGAANIAAQRAYFNFIAFQGILHAPQIDVTLPSIVAGQTATLSTTITGGSGTYSYQWISTNGSTFSNPVGTVFEGEPIETEFLLTVPNDTIKLLVQDSCGRRSVYGAGVSDTPPVLGENFTGCFQADGVLVPAVGPVSISDAGTTLASAAVRLTNRPDGAAETLVINQSLAASHGITIESDGNGGFNLSGTATHAQYDAVLESLQYVNSLANPTLVNRTITVTVNDGASDSNFLTSTLQPPTMGSFTGTPGGSPVTSYYENGILYLSVNDQTGNTTGSPDTISVSLQSSTETETLTLTETGDSTGVFTGQIQSSTTTGIGDDDILNAPVGTSVTGSHVSVAGCGAWTGSVSIVTPTYEYKPLYFTPDLAMDRVDPVGTNDTTTATQAMIPSPGGEDLTGMAVWSGAGGGTLEYQQWQGETFGPLSTTTTGATDRYRTMAAASAPTRNEHIVIGVGLDNDVDAMLWNGTAWSQISISGNTDLGTVTNDAYWGAEVAYEQTSGNPMLVWTDGTALKYAKGTWNGSSYTWSAATTISTLAATPTQLRLAADPTSNEMILAVNYANEIDTAIVWDGTTWGNEQILDANTGHDRTDIYVAYEQQSGDALVVYATGTTGNLAYYTWNGTWNGATTITPPTATNLDGYAQWTVLASDPNSDRIVLGVVTSDQDAWMRIWNGSSWGTAVVGTTETANSTSLNIAAAFESVSGQALVVFGNNQAATELGYRVWTPSTNSWSATTNFVASGDVDDPELSMTLDPNPISDQIMLLVQDNNEDLDQLVWDGTGWSSVTNLDADTNDKDRQPFVFLWDQNTTPFNAFRIPVSYDGPDADAITGADTFVDLDETTQVHGAENTIKVKATDNQIGLLQFDLNGLTETGQVVESATLRVYVSNQTNASGTVDLVRVTGVWNETVSNNTRPSWDDPTVPANVVASFLPTTDNSYYEIDVTSVVAQWLDGSLANNGLALIMRSGGNDDLQIDTKEASLERQPVLTILTREDPAPIETFTQTPAFASNFDIMSAAPVTVTAYVQITEGMFVNPPDMDATLKNATTNTTLLSLTGVPTVTVVNAGQQIYKIEWTGVVPPDKSAILANQALSVTLKSNESFSFDILHDSRYYPSGISLPTEDVIALAPLSTSPLVESPAIYDAAYPAGSAITGVPTVGTTVFIRAKVTDPFGKDDITSLDVVIKNAAGATVLSTTLTDTHVIAALTTADSKTYQLAWTPNAADVYTIETTAHEGFEGTISATGETTFDVAVVPDVIVTKSDADTTVSAGQTVQYVLSYENVGSGNATGVIITETVPANATFNAGASSSGWTGGPSTYTYDVGILAPGATGSVTFAVTVDSTLPAGVAQVANTATISADNEPEGNQTNNSGSDSTPVDAAPDLRVTKSDADATFDLTTTPTPTDTVTYTISYTNAGTQGATGVVITETLPPNTTIHPDSLSPTGSWTFVSGMQYETEAFDLAAGASGTVQIKLVVDNPLPSGVDVIANTAAIADDGTNGDDLTPGDNTDTEDTPVTAAPDLYVLKTDGDMQTVAGGTVLYTITYGNMGSQDARQVTLYETLPPNTTFDAINSVGDWDFVGGSEYVLVIGDVAVGETGTAVFAVTVNEGTTGQIDNTVLIADDGGNGEDPVPGNNTAIDSTPIVEPSPTDADLQITKTDGLTEVNPGTVVTYTIVVTNAGPAEVLDATVADTLPEALTGISWTAVPGGGASVGVASGTGDIFDANVDLPAGGTVTYTVTGTVAADAAGDLINIATV